MTSKGALFSRAVHQRDLCHFPYLDNAIFLLSKINLIYAQTQLNTLFDFLRKTCFLHFSDAFTILKILTGMNKDNL